MLQLVVVSYTIVLHFHKIRERLFYQYIFESFEVLSFSMVQLVMINYGTMFYNIKNVQLVQKIRKLALLLLGTWVWMLSRRCPIRSLFGPSKFDLDSDWLDGFPPQILKIRWIILVLAGLGAEAWRGGGSWWGEGWLDFLLWDDFWTDFDESCQLGVGGLEIFGIFRNFFWFSLMVLGSLAGFGLWGFVYSELAMFSLV